MEINNNAPVKTKKNLAISLGISRQSLYYKPKMIIKDLILKAQIEKVMSVHKSYGHKRIAQDLKIGKKRVLRVMKLFNLTPEKKRKAPSKQGDINQEASSIPNLIKEIIVERENQVWVADFTYIKYHNRFIYLATIEDLFTRQIIGYDLSSRHDASLVNNALLMALSNNNTPDISHSDQGSEYRSKSHKNLLQSANMQQSMSKKGSPWENGYKESFYAGFKLELGSIEDCNNLGEVLERIAIQIYYYNNLRIHSALGCPPRIFAEKMRENIEKVEIIKLDNCTENGICV